MGEIRDTFGEIIDTLQSATSRAGAAKFSRMARGGTYEGRNYAAERGVVPSGGAALMITLDKEDFARANNRANAYINIPYHTGTFALSKVGHYILHGDEHSEGPVERAFRTQSAPNGTPWEALSRTQEWARGAPGPILEESGALKRAATSESQMMSVVVTGQYARMVLTPERLEEETRFKFFTHQLGSDNGWGMGITIPARPFFPTGPDDLEGDERTHIQTLVEQGVAEGIEERANDRRLRLARGMRG